MVKEEIKEEIPIPGVEYSINGIFRHHTYEHPLINDAAVYPQLHATMSDWDRTSPQDASPYVPAQQEQEPIKVDLGISPITTVSLSAFNSINLGKHFQYKRAHLFNTGGAICGLDFAPKTTTLDSQPNIHYLATGGYKEPNVLHSFETPRQGYQNCIQLWKCDLATSTPNDQVMDPVLDLVFLHDYGHVRDLKWCPYGAYEETVPEGLDGDILPKLGILSGCFGDGTVRSMVVPHPNALRAQLGLTDDHHETIYLKIKQARCVFALPNASATTIAYGGHKKLAIGYSSGNISLWNMTKALENDQQENARDIRRSTRFMIFNVIIHDAGVQAIAWHGMNDPVNIASGGNDGKLTCLDSRDPYIPMNLIRTRSIQPCVVWPGHRHKILYADADLMLKDLETQDCKDFKSGSNFAACSGFTLSMAASEQHSYIVFGSSAGYVRTFNTLAKKVKAKARIQNVIFRLIYHEDTKVYRYVDGLQPESIDTAKAMPSLNRVLHHNMSISKVCWNPNSLTSAWIASAGPNGLCRLDFVGAGKDWD
ncbi:WD40-repeat-containing domain protein [Absidia repens]|uniref:WD40-repeat-containing domain protein n=1 Tax=Absidia repens TaxID=90262 RepID=A0A1X2J1G3_9FUNG|nr:WD40-repeat-containing domain protein [Absidia repens]